MRIAAPLVASVVAVLLTVGFFIGLYQPKASEQSTLEAETASLQQQQNSLRAEIARLEDLKASQGDIRDQIDRLALAIPDGVEQPEVIDQFQTTADRAGVEITSLTFGEAAAPVAAPTADGSVPPATPTGTPDTGLAGIPVTMVVEGEYGEVVDFFQRLETDTPRAVLTQNVTLGEAEAKLPVLAVTWGGQLFSVMPTASLGVDGTTTPAPATEGQQ